MQIAEQIKLIAQKIMGLQKQLEKEQMKDLIRRIAIEYKVDPEKAIQVAINESSLNPKATNRNKDKRKTLDRGLYMINSYWHAEIPDNCCYDPECSTRFFCKRVKQGYATDWFGAENVMWIYKNGKKVLI